MQDFQSTETSRGSDRDSAGVNSLAWQVVSLLADRLVRAVTEARESVVASLIAATLSGSADDFPADLSVLKHHRTSLAGLAGIYIPQVARRMGEDWLDDQLSWIEVTVGVGRLQSHVREIGNAWPADQAGDTGLGTVMLLIPDREQHTLGPMVAMGQLRRYDVSVCLRIVPTHDELRSLMATRNFDGVLISVATEEMRPSVAKTVQFLRNVSAKPKPIMVGGAVSSKVDDPASCTDADLSSNDGGAALEAIGLRFDAFCVLKRA